ncbi:MAG: hypothetical protein WB839_19020 [Pseudolabrys sp.]
MQRRQFIALLGGAATWPLVALAQQDQRVRRIGVLMAINADDDARRCFAAVSGRTRSGSSAACG